MTLNISEKRKVVLRRTGELLAKEVTLVRPAPGGTHYLDGLTPLNFAMTKLPDLKKLRNQAEIDFIIDAMLQALNIASKVVATDHLSLAPDDSKTKYH